MLLCVCLKSIIHCLPCYSFSSSRDTENYSLGRGEAHCCLELAPSSQSKKGESKTSKDGEQKPKVRKRRLEADEDKSLIKKIKSGQGAIARNERQTEELQTLSRGIII